MRVVERDEGLRAVTDGKTVTVRLGDEWEYADDPPEDVGGPGYRLSRRAHVRPTADVELPPGGVAVVASDGEEQRVSREETAQVTGTETVVSQSAIPTLCRPVTGGTVRVDAGGEPTVETNGPVTLGWITPPDAPVERITVGDTPQTVADAVTAASVSLPSVHSPRRTWPNARAPAPLFTLDGDGHHPAAVDQLETDIQFVLPEREAFAHVVAVSTLAYYLCADVTITETEAARLHAADTTRRLGTEPAAVDRAASRLLRRSFYLDCLARCVGPSGTRLREADAALAHVRGDAQELFDLDIGPRVARHLAADDGVDETLPRWPEVVHVAPDRRRLPRLSRYLGRLADVRLPRGDELTVADLSGWEPDAPVRGQSDRVPTARVVPEAHGEAGVVGWDAPGRPMGAFDARGDASSLTTDDDEGLEVVIVRCGWQSPHGALSRWRAREADLALDIEIVSRPTTDELLDVMRRDVDVVHLAAHHETGSGVKCADGHLQAYELSDVSAGVVVANCCGSERWARKAVDNGAAAAVATTGPIPIKEAERDGADLAGLLSLGWCVERAVGLLRQTYEGTGWVTVGDGGERITEFRSQAAATALIDTEEDEISIELNEPSTQGRRVDTIFTDSVSLTGNGTYELEEQYYDQIEENRESPVVINNKTIDWPPYSIDPS